MSESAVNLLREYIACPSVSTDPGAGAGMRAAKEFVAGQLSSLGFAVEEVATPLHPILLGKRLRHPGAPHVLIYAHYDVQPADPLDLWTSPAFRPEVRGRRIYGRGAADNKGPTIVHLAALREVLTDDPDLPLNFTYLIEGEEEIGSPSFPSFLRERQADLQADFALVSDTGSPSPEQIVITTALRGLTGFHVELQGPRMDLHSGIHGGAVRNPIQALGQLMASLHHPDGRVNIEGFYDGVVPVPDWEKAELAKHPGTEEQYRQFLGVKTFAPAAGLRPLEAVRFGPTLEFNGVGGGFQGEGSKTVIPSRAFVKITCRLVANQSHRKIGRLLEKTLRERCPPGVEMSLRDLGGGDPYLVVPPGRENSDPEQPAALAAAFQSMEKAIATNFGHHPLYLREGGSIPIIADLKKVAGLDSIMVGLFTPEDNLHAPDESFHLDILEQGITTFAAFFCDLAAR